jgi:hypothetical protein
MKITARRVPQALKILESFFLLEGKRAIWEQNFHDLLPASLSGR